MTLLGRRAECEQLDVVLADALAGRSRAVVLRGEAGVGKSALLRHVSERAGGWRLAAAAGVESEMELPYSGLHQLCAPMLGHLERLPAPQRAALATVFGRHAGPPPDPFLVGLATLTLLAEVAELEPLLVVIDDAQWLDAASARILGFVARRLQAERIAVIGAVRTDAGEDLLAGLPALPVGGLGASDARALLLRHVHGPFDAGVREQIVAESHGNPLALLELPRTWHGADLAGGFALPAGGPVAGRIERSYAERLLRLPADTQMLVLVAAAEPLGDPVLLQRAVATLGLGMDAAGPAEDAGLLTLGGHVEFAHPLVRSAAYRAAVAEDRRRAHRALAESTDAERDPDRRAWHRAHALAGPDEEVAAELERSADRAQARGGLAAAAAFLESAARLSPDTAERARRALAAADAKQLAGDPQSASGLLATAIAGPLDERESALAQRMQGQIALDLRRIGEAVPVLLEAARRLESIEPTVARDTYLEALRAAHICVRFDGEMLHRAAAAAREVQHAGALSGFDVLLAGLAVRSTDGYAASAATLGRAVRALWDEDRRGPQDVRWPGFARAVALDVFDDEACHALHVRSVELARERGALGVLPLALNHFGCLLSFEGDLVAAQAMVEESDAIADATGAARIGWARMTLAGFRGDEAVVSALAAAEPAATERREGVVLGFGEHAVALLHNGRGDYEAALSAAESAWASGELNISTWSLPELVEAAVRSGRRAAAAQALERLTERTQAARTELALGIEARARALLAEGSAAEALYREAVDRLGRCRLAPDRARAHLLYGEWLRREGRRIDARDQLRTAHDMLAAMGVRAFAQRARRELLATGEKVRKRTPETRDSLTAQEAQIAQLAREGHSNPEIGAQLFLSPRTVEWHMHRVFTKLGISSRRELRGALRARTPDPQLA